MSARFEEIDRRETAMGTITVRRRFEPTLEVDVYEVKLGDEFLMSSLFTVAEIQLAELALAEIGGADLDVVVGGLGLGYTARAALADPRVRSVHVVEALDVVIEWQERDLLPFAADLVSDDRCHLIHGDFFAMVACGAPFGAGKPERADAILVDIDHTPTHLLHPSHAPFYEARGLARLAARLRPDGVFGLWSDGSPDAGFVAAAESVFSTCVAHTVTFPNFYTGETSSSTVYVARAGPD
ncbi:MAG TPA: spermidine synthase [Acidimicrobiia bacterium]|nr:spermidine synthase [Acidimicrobiia bacterium]